MITKPNPGDPNWAPVINAALDTLEASVTAETNRAQGAEGDAKILSVRLATANATMSDADDVLFMNKASAGTVTMHDPATAAAKFFTVKNIGAGAITISGTGPELPYVVTTNQLIDLLTDGTNWRLF